MLTRQIVRGGEFPGDGKLPTLKGRLLRPNALVLIGTEH